MLPVCIKKKKVRKRDSIRVPFSIPDAKYFDVSTIQKIKYPYGRSGNTCSSNPTIEALSGTWEAKVLSLCISLCIISLNWSRKRDPVNSGNPLLFLQSPTLRLTWFVYNTEIITKAQAKI